MYGKIFSSMFNGSLYGSGAINFAVMSYVIAHMRPDRNVGAQVELNPRALADTLGEDEAAVVAAIEFLCAPDASSRSAAEEGRRLVKLGQFDYRVVNGAKYRAIRDEETRRESNRAAQQRSRAKKPRRRGKAMAKSLESVRGDADARERRYVREWEENGDSAKAGEIAAEGLPDGGPVV